MSCVLFYHTRDFGAGAKVKRPICCVPPFSMIASMSSNTNFEE